MKKILFATLATIAMVACSNDELISQAAPEAITFDTFVENATRSVDPSLTLDGLKEENVGFGVYGFVTGDTANAETTTAPIFTNEHVTYENGAWTTVPLSIGLLMQLTISLHLLHSLVMMRVM